VPTSKPFGYWRDKQNQKAFFDQLATKWNIQKNEDWDKVTNEMVLKEGGSFIMTYYNGLTQGMIGDQLLLLLALQAIYPDYVPTTKPLGYWKDKKNQKEFFDQLAIKWNIQKPEDWNKVTNRMVLKEGRSFITNYYNGSLKQGTDI
jgi:hypothetical protein